MRRELVGSNVVIVAQHFNPSVASQLWLVRTGLVAEEDFEPGCIFTEGLVQVCSRRFVLLVTPEQLQLVPKVPEDEQGELIAQTVGTLVHTLPHTPFRAVGINFIWHLVPDDGDVCSLTRELFFIPDRPLFRDFDVADANFGGYLSKDLFGFRLKLDVKPIMTPQLQETPPEHRMQCLFNYHADLPQGEEAVDTIERLLHHWPEAAEVSRRMAETIQDRGDA
jgi:hypothetical protein